MAKKDKKIKTKTKTNKIDNGKIKVYVISLAISVFVLLAIGFLIFAFGKNPEAALNEISKGNAFYEEGNYQSAYSSFRKAMFFDRTNRDAILLSAKSAEALNNNDTAANIILKGIKNYPGYYDFYQFLIAHYVKTDNTQAAIDFMTGIKSTAVLMNLKEVKPANPTSSPSAGSYDRPIDVSLSVDKNLPIYYTTDGTTPTLKSPKFDAATPITVGRGKTTINAITVNEKYMISDKVSLVYNVFGDDQAYVFEDPKIEAMVKATLGKTPEQPVLFRDMIRVQTLSSYDKAGNKIDGLIRSLKDLTAMNELATLDLAGEPAISDYSLLTSLSSLKRLTFDDCGITDSKLPQILANKNLIEININNNQITTLAPLSELKELTTLSADNNQITSLQGIDKLEKITSLSLSNNKITDITTINNLAGLKIINLSFNNIATIAPLLTLTNVEELNLQQCNISQFAGLNVLKTLKNLNISSNPVTNFNFFTNLTNLETLNMSNIKIEDLSFLERINIRRLTLLNCGITDISSVVALSNLESIDFRNSAANDPNANNITNVTPLSVLAILNTVYLDNNANLVDITPLNDAPSLKFIYCQGCPGINKYSITNPNIKVY